MTPNRRRSLEALTQMFDVQLLDLFAEVESLVRAGREIQRDALRMRRAAATRAADRRVIAQRVQKRVDQIGQECETFCDITALLAEGAANLRAAVMNKQHRRRDDDVERRDRSARRRQRDR